MLVIVDSAKQELLQAKTGILHAMDTTPDDPLNWSPSPTSRTPIQELALAAASIGHLHETFRGNTYAVPTRAEADAAHREFERQFSSREVTFALFDMQTIYGDVDWHN